jgi:HNH endonuclease
VVEVDHLIPRCFGGKDEYRRLQLLHARCHDDKSAFDGSTITADPEGINDNDHFIEERCAWELSRIVLHQRQRRRLPVDCYRD